MGNLTVRQFEEAIRLLLTAYQDAGKVAPSLSKLKLALEAAADGPLQDFLSDQLAPKRPTKKPARTRAPSAAVSERIDHFKVQSEAIISNPSELEMFVQSLREEAHSKKKGTLTKSALEFLSFELTGVLEKFPSIDIGVDTIRQRLIEKINAKRSLEHSRDHKAY
ncbi:MAG: hypothetical protein R3B98_01320 [Hyphomonas sp.]